MSPSASLPSLSLPCHTLPFFLLLCSLPLYPYCVATPSPAPLSPPPLTLEGDSRDVTGPGLLSVQHGLC